MDLVGHDHRRSAFKVGALAPELPATLASSALGQRVYQDLGFEAVGRAAHWTSAMPPSPPQDATLRP